MIDHPHGDFALFVGELPVEAGEHRRKAFPFEVWVNGAEQPRGLGALAKTLSMDMRANDARVAAAEARRAGRPSPSDRSFEMPFPPHGERRLSRAWSPRTAAVLRWRCEQLGALPQKAGARRRCSTRCSACEEPSTGTDGTLAWTVDIANPATGEEFVLGAEGDHAARRHPDAALLDVALGPLPARARRPGASSSRSTCACSTRRGSA